MPYLRSWEIGQDRPDLLADVASGYDYFTDMFHRLDQKHMVKPPFSWLFIGPEGVIARR